jgi:hypothetical protein
VLGPDGLVEKGTKTHTARRVALDEHTLRAVAEHRDRMGERPASCRVQLRDDAFVFSETADGTEPWFPDSVSRAFKRLCTAEGLRDVRLHDLRHVVATQLLSAGVDVRTVAGRLGHRNAATTLNVCACAPSLTRLIHDWRGGSGRRSARSDDDPTGRCPVQCARPIRPGCRDAGMHPEGPAG